jgi:hypothetical protein
MAERGAAVTAETEGLGDRSVPVPLCRSVKPASNGLSYGPAVPTLLQPFRPSVCRALWSEEQNMAMELTRQELNMPH